MKLHYKERDRYAITYSATIDADEIESLALALTYIKNNRAKIIQQAKTYTECTYYSRGGCKVGFYFDPKDKKTGEFLDIKSESVFINSVEDLAATVAQAQAKIKEIGGK